MKPEVVEGARNLRLILTSDARPAILGGLNLSQEELMLRLCNDVLDADLEVKGLQERLRHRSEAKVAELDGALAREREIGAELSKQVAMLRSRDIDISKAMAFTPLAAALKNGKSKAKRKHRL